MQAETTIVEVFSQRVAADPHQTALHFPSGDSFASCTWTELAEAVLGTAVVLIQLGVNPGDRVALFSPNRREWIVTDLAIQLARAVHVPVHNSLSGAQAAFQISDSDAKVVLLAGPEQAEKLASQLGSLPTSLVWVSFDRCGEWPGPSIRLLTDLTGNICRAEMDRVQADALKHSRPDDLATILYTSGTTGEPKGVMLSQRNLASNALASLEAFGGDAGDLRLTWLPLSHIFARTCDLYTWLAGGSQLALAASPESVVANCGQLRPTLMNGVPYFFEKVQRYLVDHGLASTPGMLAQVLGGRLRACVSGGAPLPDHVARFYQEQGVLLLQGYGMTESAPVITTGTQAANKLGTVGRALPGVEVRIAADGEVLTRGPHVMLGYWKRPTDTAAAIENGWLRTGDIGELDDEGFLRITGRKKELIITSGGKNIAPAYLESLLIADSLILQALVVGDRQNYLTALIVPNRGPLERELAARGVPVPSESELLTHPSIIELYAERIAERLTEVSQYEQVQRFTLLPRSFSVDQGELTPTLKLRRSRIAENFAQEIAAMYARQ